MSSSAPVVSVAKKPRTASSPSPSPSQINSAAKAKGTSIKPKKAIWFFEDFNALSRFEKEKALPFCVGENVTVKQFHDKCKDGKKVNVGFRWEFKNGKVWIYELAHEAHDGSSGKILQKVVRQMGAFEDDVDVVTTPTWDNNAANWSYEPDGVIKVAGYRPGPGPDAMDVVGNRWPNLVVEVALNESEPHVRLKALDWLNTCTVPGTTGDRGVQQVIVIKIGTNLRADGHRTMKAMRFERGQPINPVQEIEFGNHGGNNGATVANLPGMQLNIPAAHLYRPNNPPVGLPVTIDLDLFFVRQKIEASF